jgi:hypothetical protein
MANDLNENDSAHAAQGARTESHQPEAPSPYAWQMKLGAGIGLLGLCALLVSIVTPDLFGGVDVKAEFYRWLTCAIGALILGTGCILFAHARKAEVNWRRQKMK